MAKRWYNNVVRFKTIGSTNRYLLDQATRGAPAGTVVASEHQSSGRGRLDRRWEAEAGTCLLASVLVRPVISQVDLHLCTTAMALSVLDACIEVCGVEPGIKWPNDLVVGERKLAGILAESDPTAPGGQKGSIAVVVGIGLNVAWPGPPEVRGTCVLDAMDPARRERLSHSSTAGLIDSLLETLLDAFEARMTDIETPLGRESLAAAYKEKCVTLNRKVRVELANGYVEGNAVDISASGCLMLDSVDGAIEVATGDVVHLRGLGAGTQERAKTRET